MYRRNDMTNKIILSPHVYRKVTHYPFASGDIPSEMWRFECKKPALDNYPLPLPMKKSDYTLRCDVGDVTWLAGKGGVTRCEPGAKYYFDRVMYFSADRDLLDNNVSAIYPDGTGLWVGTSNGVTHIELPVMTAEQVSEILLDETLKYVSRHGQISHKYLARPRDPGSILPYGSCDNDGGFTSQFCLGEIFKYDVLKREKGIDAPETKRTAEIVRRSLDVCLLLMYIHGRGDGFVSRSFSTSDEPIPDDGLFFRRHGNKAICLDTSESRERGIVGLEVDCSAPIPECLRYIYEDEGFTEDDLIFKCDTSSDEITLHLLNLLFAHRLFACDYPELDELIIQSAKNIVSHIIDNGYRLIDFTGEPTTWARWDEPYFQDSIGWVDAPLNSAEILFYLLMIMDITGEQGKWRETYNYLALERGYADMTTLHFDRLYQGSMFDNMDWPEEIMYGDHWLATASLFGLCYLEKDEQLLAKYRAAYKSWRSSMAREHDAALDFLYMIACPDESVETERIIEWFSRANISRLAAGVSLKGRHDIPVRVLRQGYEEISTLPPQDEKFISKYDRNPLEHKNVDSGGVMCIESCYVFTQSYWMGRYFGFIGEA